MSRIVTTGFAAALALAAAGGCSEPKVIVKGRVVANGQPLKAGSLEVTLQSAGSPDGKTPGRSFPATLERDGTFTVQGGEGKGFPPGTYKITVASTAIGSAERGGGLPEY